MPLWPFRKRLRAPGFSLNRHFYLSVLGGSGPLPPLLQLINPQGSNGAVRGYGAPLSEAVSKDILNQPLARGSYVLTTTDKLNVLQVDTFLLAEVPDFRLPSDPVLLKQAALTGERLRRAEAAQHLVNILFKAYQAELYPAVQFILDVAARLGALADGVIADPLAEVYRLPQELHVPSRLDRRIDFREVGSVKVARLGDGLWVSTRGLAKFNLPEVELYGVPEEFKETAAKMVVAAAQQALVGMPLKPGETAFAPDSPLEIVQGTKQRHEWGDRPTLELRDPGAAGAAKGVAAWARLGN